MDLFSALVPILTQPAGAAATLQGGETHPDIRGVVRFYQTAYGVLVAADVEGLPSPTAACTSPIFAIHIHSGGTCTGNFADVGSHYNPGNCPHPYHAGDLPPLFGCDGRAFLVVLTDRFTLAEIIGKTVILHADPDDFATQPAGNAGEKLACGVIRSLIF